MKRLRLALIALALGAAAAPAQAATIGLLGGDIDPQSIFDPTPQRVDAGCLLATSYPYCAQYEILPDRLDVAFAVHSIDFQLQKLGGGFYSTEFVGNCEVGLCVDAELSDLEELIESPLFPGGITFRLLSDRSIHCVQGKADCDAEFFSNVESPGVSIVAVNGIASVPEPGTLLLLGPGVAALVARRRQQRSTTLKRFTQDGTSPPSV